MYFLLPDKINPFFKKFIAYIYHFGKDYVKLSENEKKKKSEVYFG